MKNTIYRVDATNFETTNPDINTMTLMFTDLDKATRVADALKAKKLRVRGPARNTETIQTNVKKAIDFVMSEIGK